MRCSECNSVLTQRNARGEPIIRNRGIVLKASGPALVCPRCKSLVPCSLEGLMASLGCIAIAAPPVVTTRSRST